MGSIIKFTLFFNCILSINNTILGQEITAQNILGVPFLSDEKNITFEEAKSDIKKNIYARLQTLENWDNSYDTLSNQKVIIIGYNTQRPNPFAPMLYRHRYITIAVDSWGSAFGFKNLEAAKLAALNECKKHSYNGSRTRFLDFIVNDSINIPDTLVEQHIKEKKDFMKEQSEKFTRAKKRLLCHDIYSEFQSAKAIDSIPPITPRIQTPIHIGYPDRQQDYASACQERIFYGLITAEGTRSDSIQAVLKSISDSSCYGVYYRSVSTLSNYKGKVSSDLKGHKFDKLSSFLNHHVFKQDPLRDRSIILPQNLFEVLQNDTITEIWIEGSSIITEDGVPLTIEEVARPVAIKTKNRLYLGVEVIMPEEDFRCYVSKPFKNKIISMAICANNLSCAKNVINTLSNAIESKLNLEPSKSTKLQLTSLVDGQLSMGRLFKPSLILGEPYYEYSTYNFIASIANAEDPFYSLYDRESFRGVNSHNIVVGEQKNLYVFLEFQYIVKRAVHRMGKYIDPDERELAKYQEVLQNRVSDALKETCSKLKGKMTGTICELLN